MNWKLTLYAVFGGALLLSSSPSLSARQQESVADAARKAQAEKKAITTPPKVYTNDDIGSLTGAISIVGPAPAANEEGAAAKPTETNAPADEKKAAVPAVKDESYWRNAFAEARLKLTDDEHELDILQREFNLKQQQYYSDPNQALREQYSRQDLDDTQQKINQKTADVQKDNQAISDLEDALRQSGGDPGWATPPATSAAPDSSAPTAPTTPTEPSTSPEPSTPSGPPPSQSQ